MDRTVPSTASEEIELYLRTIYSLLRSTTEVQIRTLEETHAGMNSSLHPDARKETPDTSAFIYSLLRLPDEMFSVNKVVMGQSTSTFIRHGYEDVESWPEVAARARRRRCLFNGKDTLACFIASRSDIDDLVPTLTAYQIEWNKLHYLLQRVNSSSLEQAETNPANFRQLAESLGMPIEDLERLRTIWGSHFGENLQKIASRTSNLRLHLLSSSLSEYWRATRTWWDNIEQYTPDILERPVYFVSSNPHSLPNLFSGYALRMKDELISFVESGQHADLLEEWRQIQTSAVPSSLENFLYYILKKYQASPAGRASLESQLAAEKDCGILRIPSSHSFDIEAGIIKINQLQPEHFDPRLLEGSQAKDWHFLQESNALILNIDYPLGLASYNVLAKVAEHTPYVLGVYIMGKAAALNSVRGDVLIPNVVQDEHSQNTFLFQNAFSAADVAPYLVYGSVLDNQKAVSVYGTFLQNARVMDVIYREGYTDIEMEAGPYLSAVYEMYRPQRHPVDEVVNLYGVPFDIGILHYASDTPLSKGKNLGAGALSYFGMDSTYATSIAIARRILSRERERLGKS